jgi:hypothetical protein
VFGRFDRGKHLHHVRHFDETEIRFTMKWSGIIFLISLPVMVISRIEQLAWVVFPSLFFTIMYRALLFQSYQSTLDLYENGFKMLGYRSPPSFPYWNKRLENSVESFVWSEYLLIGKWGSWRTRSYDEIIKILPYSWGPGGIWGLRILFRDPLGTIMGNDVDTTYRDDSEIAIRILMEKIGDRWEDVFSLRVVGGGKDSEFGKAIGEKFGGIVQNVKMESQEPTPPAETLNVVPSSFPVTEHFSR